MPARAATYRGAGVDIAGADRWLTRLGPAIRSTHGPGVMPDRGQFAALFQLSAAARGLRDPILVSSTDGTGTKLKLAQLLGRHRGIGIDAVAMNTNDILVYGAKPLFFLDYLAVGKLAPRVMSQLVEGVAEGCRQSGCALIGGETAEMPGVYAPEDYDLAGFCVGVVDRAKLLDGSQVRAGDAIIGLASSGVHANGFSLVRRVFSAAELRRHGNELLTPTRIYVKPVLALLARFRIHAIAHVTGGGLRRRAPSLVARQPGLRAVLEPGTWRMPAIFPRIQRAGRITDEEMHGTFNMGLGMVLACRSRDAEGVVQLLARHRVPAWTVGHIERKDSDA